MSPSYNCRLPAINPNLLLSGAAFNLEMNEEDLEKRFFLERECHTEEGHRQVIDDEKTKEAESCTPSTVA